MERRRIRDLENRIELLRKKVQELEESQRSADARFAEKEKALMSDIATLKDTIETKIKVLGEDWISEQK